MSEKHKMGADGILDDGTHLIPITPQDFELFDQGQESLSQLSVPVLLHANDPHERLFIANFDGTGNDADNDPEHITNVSIFRKQLNEISNQNSHIATHYLSGPGTQSHVIPRVTDGAVGYTYDKRIETMYEQLIQQAQVWRKEDPNAQIRVATVGFSRGAEQAAGFTRLVHERGIQDWYGEEVQHHWFRSDTFTYGNPPLVAPGKTPQAVMLFDPVGTGRPYSRDRQLPPSVVSGLQITARDERRNAFPSTLIVPQGASEDGRFLNITVPGAHSDIGGSYHHNGLAILNRNLAVDYLNALSDTPLLKKQTEPQDLNEYMIHRSEDHQMFYGTGYVREHGVRGERGAQSGAPDCRATIACLPPELLDPAVSAQVTDRHLVSITPVPTFRSQTGDPPASSATAINKTVLNHASEASRILNHSSPRLDDKTPPPRRLDDTSHPDHALYQQARIAVHQLDANHQRTPDRFSDQLAAALVVSACREGMHTIDEARLGTTPEFVFAVQRHSQPIFDRHVRVNTIEGLNKPVLQSSAEWEQVMQQKQQEQASQQQQPLVQPFISRGLSR